MENKTPWGPIGYITLKRTYARRLKENDSNSATEEFSDIVDRVVKACDKQLNVGFTQEEESELRSIFLNLKGIVAGRFLWQLGTKTVDKLGLLSLQNCAFTVVDEPIRPFTWAMDALMLGSGVGYNIQREYVYELPKPKRVKIVRLDTNDADFIVPDSREGWIELLRRTLEAHFITGKGFSYSSVCVRGKGTVIKGFGGTASGPEDLCWGMNEISKVLNARAGKKVRSIDALDVMNIIGAVVVAGNVRRSAQLAIGDIDDLQFLNAKRWDLGGVPNWRAMSNNSVVCNDISLLPEQFWQGYMGNGEPYGLINLNLARAIGRTGDTTYPDPEVCGFNPCVTGDTEILTRQGYQRIDSLLEAPVEIWNGSEWSEVQPKITGKNQEMLKISFNDGRTLTCTKYHKFHIAKDYFGNKQVVEAKDLNVNDKLIKHSFPVIKEGEYHENAYMNGFTSTFYSDRKPLIKLLVPFEWNLESKLNWLAGLFDGAGTELKEGGVQLVSSDRSFFDDLQKLLSTVGVQSKVLFDGEEKQSFFFTVGAEQVQFLKSLGLRSVRMSFDKTSNEDEPLPVKVVKIEEVENAETVYCFTEPKNNTGIFNGILAGNCAEQSLAPYETCCLAEVFLPNIESSEELNKVIKYLYRINKHSLALDCHMPETQAIVHKNMRMGIGVTGYLQATEEQRSWLKDAYTEIRSFDKIYSKAKGYPESIKLTTVKPSGTLSLLAGVTPGAHPGFSRYYIRRVRMASNIPLVENCRASGFPIEFQRNFDGTEDKNTVIVSFPCSLPESTKIAKDMTAIDQLEVVKELQSSWSDNAVSVTIYYRKEELESIRAWLKSNFNSNLKTVSFLLHNEHGFDQAPMEEITKEQFDELSAKVTPITNIQSVSEKDVLNSDECASGVCPVK